MLEYIAIISTISTIIGGILCFSGGIFVLVLLEFFSSLIIITLSIFRNISFIQTLYTCIASIVFVNFGWFGAVIFANIHPISIFGNKSMSGDKIMHGQEEERPNFGKNSSRI